MRVSVLKKRSVAYSQLDSQSAFDVMIFLLTNSLSLPQLTPSHNTCTKPSLSWALQHLDWGTFLSTMSFTLNHSLELQYSNVCSGSSNATAQTPSDESMQDKPTLSAPLSITFDPLISNDNVTNPNASQPTHSMWLLYHYQQLSGSSFANGRARISLFEFTFCASVIRVKGNSWLAQLRSVYLNH